MKRSWTKFLFTIAGIIVTTICLFNSIQRDIFYVEVYNSDLRNRVVGARLIADGISPYFYKWKKIDGIRYYDPSNFTDGSVSSITASPFFHRLMIPLSDLPQSKIANTWLYIEYLLIGLITLIGISLSSNPLTKGFIIVTGLTFLFTDAWKHHVLFGQSYLLIPFLLAVFTWLLCKGKSNFFFLAAGSAALMLILVRPNFVIFFLPFLIFLSQLKLRKIGLLFLPTAIAFVFFTLNPFEVKLWKDYISAIKEHTHMHQGEPYKKGYSDQYPNYSEWEGLDMGKSSILKPEMKIFPKSERGNFFKIWELVTHRKIGTDGLLIISILLIGLLLSATFITYGKLNFETINLKALILFGFCLYMITDIFSPIHRHQYNTMQWIFPIMLFFSVANYKKHFWFYFSVIVGLVLNVFRVPFIYMEHTIGEYLIFAALLIFSFRFFKLPTTIE